MDKNSVQGFGDNKRGAFSVGPRIDFSSGTSLRPTASLMWNNQGSASAYGLNASQKLGNSGWSVNAGANTGGGFNVGFGGSW